MAGSEAGAAGWWRGIGRFRRVLLGATPALLLLTTFVFAPQGAHFGWGFFPTLIALPLLGLLLVFTAFDGLHAALSWLAQGKDQERATRHCRVLLFDAVMVGYFGVSYLLLLLLD